MNGFAWKSAQMDRPDPFGPILEPKPSRKRPSRILTLIASAVIGIARRTSKRELVLPEVACSCASSQVATAAPIGVPGRQTEEGSYK